MPYDGDKPSILLVNDDKSVMAGWLRQIARALPGANITTVFSAYEAIQKIRELKPNAVILDVTLPESEYNPSALGLNDLAEYSSKVGQIYRDECPEGLLIVASTYSKNFIHRYPVNSKFVDTYRDYGNVKLNDALSGAFKLCEKLSEVQLIDIKTKLLEESPRLQSRIQAVRDGLFHFDPERKR